MKRLRETILKRRVQLNRGTTLVEIMVGFMLLSIFVVASSMLIASVTNVYIQAKGSSYGIQVCQMISNRITAELEGAINGDITSDRFIDGEGIASSGAIIYNADRIEFTNKEGSHVNIGLIEQNGKKFMVEHFYDIPSFNEGVNLYDAVDWTFDAKSYMGYSVESIHFSRPMGDTPYNVFKVDITVTSPKYGNYTTTKYIECYNFDENIAPTKVVEAVGSR